jgi:hypothetical protein
VAALTSALILGGTALAGAAISSNAAKNAAKTTNQAAQGASDSSLQAAREVAAAARQNADKNNALQADIYGQNRDTLNPFIASGSAAQNGINAFLGLPVYKTEETPDYEGYVNDNADILKNYEQYGSQFPDKAAFGQWFSELYGDDNPAKVKTTSRQVLDGEAAANQEKAFENFRNATGYQFALDQGIGAVDQSAVSRGMLNSGKTIKDAMRFGTGLASQSAGQYLNYLSGQQSVGANAANALTGVNNTYATNVTNNNTSATNAAANALLGGTSASNNALAGAANTNANAGLAGANQVSNLLGQAVSAYGAYRGGTSSYGGGATQGSTATAPPWPGTPGYGLNVNYA